MAIDAKTIEEFAKQKPVEDRLYIILYYDAIDEKNTFDIAIGRREAYRIIKEACMADIVDPEDMTVLVEYITIDRNTEELKWSLMHPDNAKNGYQFCKAVESSIPEEDKFPIEDYTHDKEGVGEEFNPGPNKAKLTMADIIAVNEQGSSDNSESITTDEYLAMINNRNQDLFTDPGYDAFDGIAPEYNPFV